MGIIMKFLLLGLILVSCATNKVQIMRWQGNYYKAIVKAIDKVEAEELGFDAAQEYCSKKGKEAVMSSNYTRYKGSMNETTRTTVRSASKVGAVLGAAAYAKGDSNLGDKIGAASAGGMYATQNKDYETEVMFKCEERI
jgi:hypothetical protein